MSIQSCCQRAHVRCHSVESTEKKKESGWKMSMLAIKREMDRVLKRRLTLAVIVNILHAQLVSECHGKSVVNKKSDGGGRKM
jgi:hypothetical protein